MNKFVKLDNEFVAEGVREALRTPGGRRFLWRIFQWCNILNTPFNPENSDVTMFKLGEQNIGMQLLALMEEVDEGAWLKLRLEQKTLVDKVKGRSEEDG